MPAVPIRPVHLFRNGFIGRPHPDLVLNGDQKLFRFRKLLKSKKRNQKRLIKEQKKTISAAVKAKLRAKVLPDLDLDLEAAFSTDRRESRTLV